MRGFRKRLGPYGNVEVNATTHHIVGVSPYRYLHKHYLPGSTHTRHSQRPTLHTGVQHGAAPQSRSPSLQPSDTLIHSFHSKVSLNPISSGPPTTSDKSSYAIFHPLSLSLPLSLSQCVVYCCGVVYFLLFEGLYCLYVFLFVKRLSTNQSAVKKTI